MVKIEKLTPEQGAYLPVFRQEYLDVAIGGKRANRDRLESAIANAYAEISKPKPLVIILQSPLQAMMAIKFMESASKDLGPQLGDLLWGQLWPRFWDQLWGQLWDQLKGQLRGQLRGQLGGQPIYTATSLWGSQDLYWIAWGKFAEHIGVRFNDDTARRLEIMRCIGFECEWWWPYENFCFVSERPIKTAWDGQRRLHCENGPAIQYEDGYALHAWNGIRVPAHWIEDRENLDPNEVIKVDNVEQRAVGAAIVGWPKMLSILKAKTIDEHENPEIGSLIELTLPGLDNPGRFLKAQCCRNGLIVEGVPRVSDIDGLPIDTALAAQAWRIGDPVSEFIQPEKRT